MTRQCAALVLAAALACPSCRPAVDWRAQEDFCLRHIAGKLSDWDRQELRLSCSDARRFGPSRLMLAGSFRSLGGAVRSVIMLSDDGGSTWRQADAWMAGCTASTAFALDDRHAWVGVHWSYQGEGGPFFVFRTADGGATWARCDSGLPVGDGSATFEGLKFTDAAHGAAFFCDQRFQRLTVATSDGGATWQAATTQPASRPASPPGPAIGQLRATTQYELRRIFIEECIGPDQWRLIAHLPSIWRMRDSCFEPAVPSTRPQGATP